MKVLVTGSSGLVGSALKDSTKNDCHTYIYLTSKDADLRLEDDVRAIFEKYKPDVVVHLAANVGGLYKNMFCKSQMFEDNILMNTFVLKYSRIFGVKKIIMMLSTCIFPDDIENLITEDDLHNGPPHPSNEGYAYAKRMMEVHGRILHSQYGIQTIFLTPTNIYGPCDNFALEDAHVVPALIHKCWLAKSYKELFIVKGSGKPLRQFIYSYDLADIILDMLNRDDIEYGHFICSPASHLEISIGSVAKMIAQNMHYDDAIVFDETYADGQYKKTVEPNAIFADRKFTSFADGIKMTVEWFVENMENPTQIRL